jgi:hypothetical protein
MLAELVSFEVGEVPPLVGVVIIVVVALAVFGVLFWIIRRLR